MRELISDYFKKYKDAKIVFDVAGQDAIANVREHWFIFSGFIIFYKNDKTNEKKELSLYSEIGNCIND